MVKNIKKKSSYRTTFRWFLILFVVLTSSFLITLAFLYKNKKNSKTKLLEISTLVDDLNTLNNKINLQYANGFVNTNDAFSEFGNFKEKTIDHIGLNDIQLLDSLSRIGREIGKFSIPNQKKSHIEIIFHLEETDALLLESNSKNFFISDQLGNRKKTDEGNRFKRKWDNEFKLLNRLFNQDIIQTKKDLEENDSIFSTFTIIFIVVFIILTLTILIYTATTILKDVKVLQTNSQLIKNGKKPLKKEAKLTAEIYTINDNLHRLYSDIDQTKKMLEILHDKEETNITKNKSYSKNILFDSISKLELQLEDLKEKEKTRSWIVKGINELTEVVNQYSNNSEKLFDTFLVKLIKYIDAIQGGIFIPKNEEELTMITSYAFDRLKKKNNTIKKGEGLVGEVWVEEKHVYVENIPKDHAHIKSGLGHAKSTSMVIAPLLERNACYGVIEISTFRKLDENELSLILKACEILAAATANIATNEHTKNLLKDSQELAKKMKDQEEELNQKINQLSDEIVEEKKAIYLKERTIRDLRFDTEKQEKTFLRAKTGLEKQLTELTQRMKINEKDNDHTRKLSSELTDKEKQIIDLEETIRIKNLKIERLKSKVEKLNKANS